MLACLKNMRVSLVKCRSCRTGCSCTAETGICTVPGGVVRYTWGTAPGADDTIRTNQYKPSVSLRLFLKLATPPVSWACMDWLPWEKALSTASPPSASAGVEAYITVWGLGYIM